MALFCRGWKLDSNFVKMVTPYMYLHLLSKFPTLHQKIEYSSLLVCITKQKSTQSKLRPSCRCTNIWIIPIVSQTAKQAEWEKEKEIEKGQTEREKTIDIYTCNLKYIDMLINFHYGTIFRRFKFYVSFSNVCVP